MNPSITGIWKKESNNTFEISNDLFNEIDGFSISHANDCFDISIKDTESRTVIIYGLTIKADQINNSETVEDILSLNLDKISVLQNYFKNLNGQFLIIILDKVNNQFFLINDRFNSIPIYYANFDDKIIISHLYFDIFKKIRRNPKFKIQQDSIIEFLWFNRLYGNKTYDNITNFLMPASILLVKKNILKINTYWRPSFKKIKESKYNAGNSFATLLKKSVKRLTSDKKKYGLFLSGGLDSRLVAACFTNQKVKSLTIGFSDNYEVECAKKVSDALSIEHDYIEIPKDHFYSNLDRITKITGAQYTFPNAIFVGLNKNYFKDIESVFHGHGIDYLFQGMYLPAKPINLLKSPTFFRKFSFKYNNIIDQFLYTIPYRVKGANILDFIKEERKEESLIKLKKNISVIFDMGKKISEDRYDLWEYIQIHTLGRHYSRANILSKQTCAKQRCVVFDNDLFDYYLSMNKNLRINAPIVRHAINNINPILGKIPTGNWGFPGGDSPSLKTLKLIIRKIKRLITKNMSYQAPSASDRTWPENETIIKSDKQMINEIKKIFKNQELKLILNFIEWETLEKKTNNYLVSSGNLAPLLVALLSISKLLELSK